jgi:ribonucleoside-triphosphate reductase
MNKGKEFLSSLKLHSDYLKYKAEVGRYEKWEEACEDVLLAHEKKYGKKVINYVEEALPYYKNKQVLASQRCLQFRYDSLLKHNTKLYNCSVLYMYSPDAFKKGFYVLLSGCGLGVNLKQKYVQGLPNIVKRSDKTVTFVIPDSIEGWSEAIHCLVSSYCKHPSLQKEYYGKNIRFDYSQIRPKGATISGAFLAPGPDGLKQSLERIEAFIEARLGSKEEIAFSSYVCYNIWMHICDAVLSGNLRRSAMNIIIDKEDKEMLYAKTGNWRVDNPHFARSNNSVGIMKGSFSKKQFKELLDLNEGDNDIGFVFLESEDQMFNPCFEISFDFFNKIKNYNDTVIQFCNLTEINASSSVKKDGSFDEEMFYGQCRAASIIGTLQAGWTSFPFLGEQTEEMVRGEALLGVSITGWMNNPSLFNPDVLKKGARIVRETNAEVAEIIGINKAARTTTCKPSGNACSRFDGVIRTTKGNMTLKDIFSYCLGYEVNPEELIADTSFIPVNDIIVYDENDDEQLVTGLYVNGEAYVNEIEFEDGSVYHFTDEHKLKTKNGWVYVKDLKEDDEIINFN